MTAIKYEIPNGLCSRYPRAMFRLIRVINLSSVDDDINSIRPNPNCLKPVMLVNDSLINNFIKRADLTSYRLREKIFDRDVLPSDSVFEIGHKKYKVSLDVDYVGGLVLLGYTISSHDWWGNIRLEYEAYDGKYVRVDRKQLDLEMDMCA